MREKTERIKEPSVYISRAISMAGFCYLKIALYNNIWERKYIPPPIPIPLLNILNFILRATYNKRS